MYNRLLDTLFDCWQDGLDEESKLRFCKDGLMLKYGQPKSYVDEQWEVAKRRVMFLVKDNPDGYGHDTRLWLVDEKNGENNRNLSGGKVGKTGFLPNIAKMLYGFMSANGNIPGFSDVKMNEVKATFNTMPFALVESKKLAGKPTVSSFEIKYALNRDELFLKKEIDILRPNIIVCCDADDNVFKFVTKRYFSKAESEKIDYEYEINGEIVKGMRPCRLWYYPSHNVVVVNSYHPTRRGRYKSDLKIYERAIDPFRRFLREHPDF